MAVLLSLTGCPCCTWWSHPVANLRRCTALEVLCLRIPLDIRSTDRAVGHRFTAGTQLDVYQDLTLSLPSTLRVFIFTLDFGNNEDPSEIVELLERVKFRYLSSAVMKLRLLRGVVINLFFSTRIDDPWREYSDYCLARVFRPGLPFVAGASSRPMF